GFEGAGVGPAFPIPQSGVEVFWNHTTRDIAGCYSATTASAVVTASGSYVLGKIRIHGQHPYRKKGLSGGANSDQLNSYCAVALEPPTLAGAAILVKDFSNAKEHPRQAWA